MGGSVDLDRVPGPTSGWGTIAAAVLVVVAEADRQSLANATVLQGAPGDLGGWLVAGTSDVTCDGRSDVVVVAAGNDTGSGDAGVAHVAAVRTRIARLGGIRGVLPGRPSR